MKNENTAEQKAKEISELIVKATELMNAALDLFDDETAAYVNQKAEETDFADAEAGNILGFSDNLSDLSRDFYYAVSRE